MNVAGGIAGKENRRATYILRATPAAGGYPLQDVRVPIRILVQRLRKARVDVARGDRVHIYASGCPLIGEDSGQARESAL